jgi:Glycosyltransferase family 87
LQVLVTAGLIGGLAALAVGQSAAHGDDLVQDYVSARAWLSGEYPYQDAAELRERFGFPPAGQHLARNPHPPLSIVLAATVAWLPFETALHIYQVFQVLGLAAAWHWACRTFARGGWLAAAVGGLLGLWSPIWQGLDWGQPVGVIALFTALLWHLARRDVSWCACGAALALACTLRPFFLIVAAVGMKWPVRRVLVEAAAAGLTAAIVFAGVGVSPLAWLQSAEQVGTTFAGQAGSIPGLLGLAGLGSVALYGVALVASAVLCWRGLTPDGTVAFGLSMGLLTYPLAWFQYDAALVPVVVWVAAQAHLRKHSPATWAMVVYIGLRCLPNVHGGERLQQWLQVLARAALVSSVLLLLRATPQRDGSGQPA